MPDATLFLRPLSALEAVEKWALIPHAFFGNRPVVASLSTNILRASWLAELFFEVKDKERPLPDNLVARFSEGLFLDAQSTGTEHPAEQMLDLLKKVSSIEVGKDGVKVSKSAAKEG